MGIASLLPVGFEEDLPGRWGRQNLLEEPCIEFGKELAPPVGDYLRWENAGIFPMQIEGKSHCYSDVCFYNGHLGILIKTVIHRRSSWS